MTERLTFELLSETQLGQSIARVIDGSTLDRESFVEMAGGGAKKALMGRFVRGDSLSRLDLQRVLRIVRELEDKHGRG